MITDGLEKWWGVFNDAGLSGGGMPDVNRVIEIEQLPFTKDTMAQGLWRMVVDVMMLARGEDFIIFPEQDGFYAHEVGLGNLIGHDAEVRNGDLAMQALIAEMNEAGSGIPYIAKIDVDALDADLFSRFCEDDLISCLYEQIYDMGRVLSYSRLDMSSDGNPSRGGGVAGGVEPTCPGCPADCEPDDEVNVADMLNLLSEWGATDFPYADINSSGNVDIADLLLLLSSWGHCAP